jgi:hypothetical protein
MTYSSGQSVRDLQGIRTYLANGQVSPFGAVIPPASIPILM